MKITMQSSSMATTGKKSQSCLDTSSDDKKIKGVIRVLALFTYVCLIFLLSSCILQSKQPNTAPSVRIVSPQDSEVFLASSLRISIEAEDAEKNLKNIKVYENGQVIGNASRSTSQGQFQDPSLPERWHFNWTASENGTYIFGAEAIDELGKRSTTFVSFEVQIPSPVNPSTPIDTIAFENYKQNLALWQQTAINSYVIDFQRICFCLPDLTQPVKLSVENHNLSDAIYLSGAAVNQSNYVHFYTINKAFSLIQEAFDAKAAEVRVVYNQEFGFPTSVFIDYDERLADEELQFRFNNFISN